MIENTYEIALDYLANQTPMIAIVVFEHCRLVDIVGRRLVDDIPVVLVVAIVHRFLSIR